MGDAVDRSPREGEILRVGYQGEQGAFSEQAARLIWPLAEPVSCRSFEDVVQMVEGRADLGGVLPVANRIVGRVSEAIEALLRAPDLVVVRTVELPIGLHLAGLPGAEIMALRQVLGHPVALAQCGRYLERHSALSPRPHYDSAAAARHLSEIRDPSVAVIAGESAIERWGLEVLERDVQDLADNVTRFIGIRRKS